MRLVSYSVGGTSTFGAVTADGTGIVELGRRLPDVADVGALLTAERLDDARALAEGAEPDHLIDDVVFDRPVPWPGKIFCIGVNYGGRNAEYRDGSAEASYPSVFVRFGDSLTGHGAPLLRPAESEQLDYEGEIVAVIGRAGRRIPRERALHHVAGLTLGNEGTIRDWVRHAKFNVTQGKNWERSGSIGPWITTVDELVADTTDGAELLAAFEQLHLTTTVNGELRQDDTPATMAFPLDYQVNYLSTFTTLRPGDLIFTGTPTGAGARHDPPVWLRPGDVVEVSVPELGVLTNTVADEEPADR
ncbi:MAG: fumarylacetoacetate hydrolase family protein [Actinomycetota bacterium]|nr:fumarylacetoacetate hydrolase family protein [Actinomycetota bacterium]